MNAIQIIQLIIQLAPAGIQLTQEVVQLIQALEAANTGGNQASHQQAVAEALAKHLAGLK